MIPLTLADIAAATGATLHQVPDPLRQVTGPLAFDSRDITPGGLFACLKGARDGHDFAHQAVADGAAAVLGTRPVDAPALIVPDVLDAMGALARAVAAAYPGTVVALTGSAGKTTTKDILASVLELDGPTVATHRSFNNEIGFPVTVTRVQSDSRYLLLEMGARGKGHIADLCAMVPPQIATVLGIGSAHIGEFGSKEATADAKAEIVHGLPAHGVAVLNADDPLVAAMATRTKARILTFSLGPHADVTARDLALTPEGKPTFVLTHGTRTAPVELGFHGRHNVTNALAAAATALAAGIPFDRVVTGLHTARLTSGGRMEVIHRPDGVTVINDAFNASPESVLAALGALADIAGSTRRRVAVLGEMAELGDGTTTWHDQVAAKVIALNVDHTIGVGGTHAQRMITTIRDAGLPTSWAGTSLTLEDIHTHLRPGDVVLVKGANALGLEETARRLAEASS